MNGTGKQGGRVSAGGRGVGRSRRGKEGKVDGAGGTSSRNEGREEGRLTRNEVEGGKGRGRMGE